jgi:hypothetical protein
MWLFGELKEMISYACIVHSSHECLLPLLLLLLLKQPPKEKPIS